MVTPVCFELESLVAPFVFSFHLAVTQAGKEEAEEEAQEVAGQPT